MRCRGPVALLALLVPLAAARVRAEPMQPIPHSVPQALASMASIGPAPAELPLENGFELGRLRPTGRGVRDSLLGPFQCKAVHGRRGYSHRRMDTALLDYELPVELIAQRPLEPRDASSSAAATASVSI